MIARTPVRRAAATKPIGRDFSMVIYSMDYQEKHRKQGDNLVVGMRYRGLPSGAIKEYNVKRGRTETGRMYLVFLGVRHYLSEFKPVPADAGYVMRA